MYSGQDPVPSPLEKGSWEGETPVLAKESCASKITLNESSCLGLQLKVGGKFYLKLNIGGRPIAHKYREGKMQRTLKRELKSTWNCWKGSEGNQCLCTTILPLPLVAGALWLCLNHYGFPPVQMLVGEVASLKWYPAFMDWRGLRESLMCSW